MITYSQISEATRPELEDIRMDLYITKMKLDRFFTVFLDNNEFDENDSTTLEWVTYNEMYKNYNDINSLIKAANYRLR